MMYTQYPDPLSTSCMQGHTNPAGLQKCLADYHFPMLHLLQAQLDMTLRRCHLQMYIFILFCMLQFMYH